MSISVEHRCLKVNYSRTRLERVESLAELDSNCAASSVCDTRLQSSTSSSRWHGFLIHTGRLGVGSIFQMTLAISVQPIPDVSILKQAKAEYAKLQ